jgi:hypothetical protein
VSADTTDTIRQFSKAAKAAKDAQLAITILKERFPGMSDDEVACVIDTLRGSWQASAMTAAEFEEHMKAVEREGGDGIS